MSKRSAHHRVKRNQQLLEAQRLLESHSMDSKPRNNPLESSSRGKGKLMYEVNGESNDHREPSVSTNRLVADSIILENKLTDKTQDENLDDVTVYAHFDISLGRF